MWEKNDVEWISFTMDYLKKIPGGMGDPAEKKGEA